MNNIKTKIVTEHYHATISALFYIRPQQYALFIGAHPSGFSGRLLTTIYKQKEFTLRIADQIIRKSNF